MTDIGPDVEKPRGLGMSVVVCGVVLAILVLGRSFLVPLAIAVLFWHLLEALISDLSRLASSRFRIPPWFASILVVGLILLGLYAIGIVLLSQTNAIAIAWPHYAERMKSIVAGLADWLGEGPSAKVREELGKIDLTRQAAGLFTSAQSLVVNIVVVFLYVFFLFGERRYINVKLGALVPDAEVAGDAEKVLSAISVSIRRYVLIKTLMSVIVGVSSYVVLRTLGADFAETWALLIFLLNYIPNLGPVIGAIFPALFRSRVRSGIHICDRRQRLGTPDHAQIAQYERVCDCALAYVLGHHLGCCGNVFKCADHGSDHDCVRSFSELAMGRSSAFEGWPHQ